MLERGKKAEDKQKTKEEAFNWMKQWMCDVSYMENKATVYTNKNEMFKGSSIIPNSCILSKVFSNLFLK